MRSGVVVPVVLPSGLVMAGRMRTPIPPTYTQGELKAICQRQGGWWHPDGLRGGYCEYADEM